VATYLNNLRLKEIATGDESGTWGVSTNTNLELVTDGFSYGTKAIAADADETFTMPDATADATRGFYLKFTSGVSLTATRTVTLGPNTVSKVWMIENATTGSQIITIKQGSGATVDVPSGSKLMVVTDGAGAGAAVLNANPTEAGSGTVTSVGGTGTVQGLTLSGTVTSSGNLTLGGSLSDVDLTSQVTGTLPVANGGTGITSFGAGVATFLGAPSSANLITAVTDETGTGALVFATSPTFVTPVLGTPASGTLTNATGLPPAGVVGTAAILGDNTFTGTQDFTGATVTGIATDPTSGSLTKTFTAGEVSTITLSGTLLAPVVGVTKEVSQTDVTNSIWDIITNDLGFTLVDSAYSVTLTPAATTGGTIEFTLGSGSWASTDIGKVIKNKSAGEAGEARVISVASGVATCKITVDFTNTDAIASGDWEMYSGEFTSGSFELSSSAEEDLTAGILLYLILPPQPTLQ